MKTLTSRSIPSLTELDVTFNCSRGQAPLALAEHKPGSNLRSLLSHSLRGVRKLNTTTWAGPGGMICGQQSLLFDMIAASGSMDNLRAEHHGHAVRTSFCQFTELRTLRQLRLGAKYSGLDIDADDFGTFLGRNQHALRDLRTIFPCLCSGTWSAIFEQL